MILLDTHIWVRWQNAPETLPPKLLNSIAESDALAVSCQPIHRIGEGLKVAMEWYVQHLTQQGKA